MRYIYKVTSNDEEWLHTTKEWLRYERDNYKCKNKECYRLDRSKFPGPIDTVIKKTPKQKMICSGVAFSMGRIFHLDFIEQIKPYMKRFVFGKCYLPDRTIVKEYVTCYTKDFVILRGAPGSSYIQCEQCKTVVGSPKDPVYVLRSSLKDRRVYQDAIQSLYIDEELALNIDFSRWPRTELEQIAIRDRPIDKIRLISDPEDMQWDEDYQSNLLYKVIPAVYPEFDEPKPVFAHVRWLKEQEGEMLCGRCHSIRRSEFPRPLNVTLEQPPEEGLPCALVETTGVTIWHVGFLEKIQDFLDGYAIGDCFLPDGSLVNEYKTCYCPEFILERGNRQSKYQVCPACGSITSSVRPGPVYILQKKMGSKEVFQDARCNFYFKEKAASLFNFKNWEVKEDYYGYYVYLESVAIRETACDGQVLPMD